MTLPATAAIAALRRAVEQRTRYNVDEADPALADDHGTVKLSTAEAVAILAHIDAIGKHAPVGKPSTESVNA